MKKLVVGFAVLGSFAAGGLTANAAGFTPAPAWKALGALTYTNQYTHQTQTVRIDCETDKMPRHQSTVTCAVIP